MTYRGDRTLSVGSLFEGPVCGHPGHHPKVNERPELNSFAVEMNGIGIVQFWDTHWAFRTLAAPLLPAFL